MTDQLELVLLFFWHLVLTGLPGAAACLFAAHRGVKQVPVLLGIALAGSAAAGLLAFWLFYADPLIGETYAFLAVGGSALLVGFLLWGRKIDGEILRGLATPALLWVFGSAFLLFLGFVHGIGDPLPTSTARFSHPLPADNAFPFWYADWFFRNGHEIDPPILATWHFSDRPPLQVGYALMQMPFGWREDGLDYQVMGVILQQLWIVGLWALLLAAGIGRVTRTLTMVAVLLSGLVFVNGFFVWPKLLPAALLLAAAALTLTPLWRELRNNAWAAALIAALVGLALLGHGSTVFGFLALVVVVAFRGLPSLRWVVVALAVGVALMAPWMAYQRLVDPSGDRLVKQTLAGAGEADQRGVLEAIADAYGKAGVDGTIDYKLSNFSEMIGFERARAAYEALPDQATLTDYVRTTRSVGFFHLLLSLGLLLLAPLAMAVGWKRRDRRPQEWNLALVCFTVFAVGAVAWGLLSFGNLAGRTVLHVSSYLLPLLAMVGAVAGLRAVFPRFALAWVGLNALLGLVLYAPALDPPPGTAYSLFAAILAAAALAAFVVVPMRGGRLRTQEK